MMETPNQIMLLLVDDETDFLDAVRPGLERRGFQVTTAENGQSALDLLSSETFDVVVLDVKMPGIDGIDTFMEIKRLAPTIPVIILTGHGNVEQAFETSREGVYDYLTKPCDVASLAELARRATAQAAPIENHVDPSDRGIRVLLVDDDHDFLDAIGPALERRGLSVYAVRTGHDAVRLAAEQELHVAVVDVIIPDMNGLLLIERLREVDPLIEIIVLTGHPSVQDARKSLKDGAFDFLTKPQPVQELLRKIRAAHLHRERATRSAQDDEVEEILSRRPD